MAKYELTLLLKDEKDLQKVEDLFKSYSVKLEVQKWGKKALSYPIKKSTSAFFYNYQFEIGPKELQEFNRKLNFNEEVLRFLVIKL